MVKKHSRTTSRKKRVIRPKPPLWIDVKATEKDNLVIGYARVSMSDQTNARQIDELTKHGCHRIYLDRASGRNMRRPGWEACRKDLRENDLLMLHAVDRLGRDLVEVSKTVRDLEDNGINLKVITFDIDTRTANGRMMLHLLAMLAQWERELMLERTMHGLAKARERGKKGGAERMHSSAIILAAEKKFGITHAHERLNPPMSKSGFMRAFKRACEEREAERIKQ